MLSLENHVLNPCLLETESLESILKDLFDLLKLYDAVVPACEYGCPWEPEDSDGYLKGELQLIVNFLTQVLGTKLMSSSRAIYVGNSRDTLSPTKIL